MATDAVSIFINLPRPPLCEPCQSHAMRHGIKREGARWFMANFANILPAHPCEAGGCPCFCQAPIYGRLMERKASRGRG